jgi:hypothetical protein
MKRRPKIELQPPREGSEATESEGLRAAQNAARGRSGKPDAADAPPPRTFAGAPPAEIPGQLKLGES